MKIEGNLLQDLTSVSLGELTAEVLLEKTCPKADEVIKQIFGVLTIFVVPLNPQ